MSFSYYSIAVLTNILQHHYAYCVTVGVYIFFYAKLLPVVMGIFYKFPFLFSIVNYGLIKCILC